MKNTNQKFEKNFSGIELPSISDYQNLTSIIKSGKVSTGNLSRQTANFANTFHAKSLSLFILLLIILSCAFSFNLKSQVFKTSSNSTISKDHAPEIPGLINEHEGRWFTVNVDITLENFWNKYKPLLGFNFEDSFVVVKSEDIGNEYLRITFQQYHNGYKVDGAAGFLYTINGLVKKLHIDFVKNIFIEKEAKISKNEALDIAKNRLGFEKYSWEVKLDSNIPDYSIFSNIPKGELVIAAIPGNTHFVDSKFCLAWKFKIADQSLSKVNYVYVDASNGQVINVVPISMHCTSTTGATAYNGTQNIKTKYYNSTYGYILTDDCGGTGYSANLTTNLYSGGTYYFYCSTNNNWSSSPTASVTSHWAGRMALSYWGSYWGRNSYDNSGSDLYVYNYSNLSNAYWNGSAIYLGDNNTSGIYDDFNTIDIVGHEFTHGIIQNTANLTYSKEPGALNESFADIFSVAIERNTFGVNGYDFLIGEDRGTPSRSLLNPKAYSQPNTYNGSYWHNVSTDPSDNYGVHTNSGVQNYWFYLLAAGGSGTNDNGFSYSVTGLYFTDAINIVHKSLTGYLSSNSNYGDARMGSMWAADQLFGTSSQQKISVVAAWCAVGLGNTCSSKSIDLTKTTDNLSISSNTVTVSNTVINTGSSSSGSFVVDFYLSVNSDFSTNDYLVTTYNVSSLNPNATYSFNKAIDLCTLSIPNGTYYIGYSIDANDDINETDESNNTWYWKYNPVTISCSAGNYSVSVSANPTNGGNVSGGGSYTSGQNATIIASPNSGWTFNNWTENSTVVSSNSSYTFSVSSNRTFVANFTQNPTYFTISTSSNPTIGGTTTGDGSYQNGQTATLIATANTGYKFNNWTENATVVSSNNSYSFSVSSNRAFVANFTQNPINYTISTSASPSVGGSTTGDGSYQDGQTATVNASANNGYKFKDWTEQGSQVSTSASYSFSVKANCSLVANFSQLCIVTIDINPSKAGYAIGAGTYLSGITATFTATPYNGYSFLNWIENGIILSTKPSFQTQVNSSMNLIANFESTVGIDKESFPNILIYPNPTTNVLYIELDGNYNTILNLKDNLGKILMTKSTINRKAQLDLTDINDGIYYLEIIKSDGNLIIKKIVRN